MVFVDGVEAKSGMPKAVVITGIGCLSPNGEDERGALNTAGFFQGLATGRSGIRAINRFPAKSLACQIAGQLPNFNSLDWVSPKDSPHLPLTVPYALAASSEALDDAGLNPSEMSLEERRQFGVVVGSGGGGVEFLERQYGLYFTDKTAKPSVYAVPSNTMGSLSSEVSMRFNLHGLSHVISTGCTSSTDAIGYAYQNIQQGRLSRAICGGVDAPITHGIITGFCLMKVVTKAWNHAPEKGSRPFSRDRDGFVLGEGAWLYVLEEKALALARGARIYAEIKGYGATCDAYHRVRMDESGTEPARAIQLAMAEAQVAPTDIDYLSLHGTSTQLNDRVETRALKLALNRQAYNIPVSSVKSMIGHPQGASGAAGMASAIFAMEKSILPPTINLDQNDDACDLDYVPDTGRQKEVEWAVCNCVGFGSKNSALVIQKHESRN